MRDTERTSWDVFIAHAGADIAPATELATTLSTQHGLHCFLDADSLRAGDGWPTRLKAALARSRVIAVLVSKHSDNAYYLQEEVAIAVALSRNRPSAVLVVPVLLSNASQMHLPYGTFSLHALRVSKGGWPPVAKDIAALLTATPTRRPSAAIGRSAELVDEIWSRLEPALTDKRRRLPEEFRLRYQSDGQDLVAMSRNGAEVQRVTRDQLDQRLSPGLLHHIEVLERAMEINKAIWDERYPRRVLDKRSKKAAESAVTAMAEDLSGVLHTIEQAGLFLDDHYMDVRQVLGQKLPITP